MHLKREQISKIVGMERQKFQFDWGGLSAECEINKEKEV